MKSMTNTALILIAASYFAASSASAQVTQKEPNSAAEAVRSALARKDGEGDNKKLLEDTLTAKDRQYSLLKSGKSAMAWDASYAYSGVKQINTDVTTNALSANNLKSHTLTNTFSFDYGLRDDLAVNISAPLVGRYSQSDTTEGKVSDMGDISVGARFQPFPLDKDFPIITLNTSVRLPTGSSPFKTFNGEGMSSGSGYTAVTAGVNISKIMDPAALFGSVSATYNLKASDLYQNRNGARLIEVDPGVSISWGAGFATALSYKVSTSMAYQQTISTKSKLTYLKSDNTTIVAKSVGGTSAMLNLGLGLRYTPASTVNFTFGVGLTSDSPDFTFGVNMPLSF
jgi:hypothetical protein